MSAGQCGYGPCRATAAAYADLSQPSASVRCGKPLLGVKLRVFDLLSQVRDFPLLSLALASFACACVLGAGVVSSCASRRC